MNTEDYVSYPLALALKKAGFDLEVNHVYDKNGKLWEEGMHENADCDCTAYFDYNKSGYIEVGASAPTLAQAQKWLREKKGYDVALCPEGEFLKTERTYRHTGWNYSIIRISKIGIMTPGPIGNVLMSKYEQALSEGIKSALELINTEDHNHE
ncbi:hypothetical protein E4T81_12220 [Barnesiella sp. WM24]|uniref:hypothetical protein n=1 Tax=Barnesiella sp. WM24 TaxID=2558278 RepID=UPI001071A2E1|nr:hypothetical protein [Barnesiella sp. WM24]TFU92347.1 hypothetical protein E4T81_12220 [Barnesiella sp. WM24]